jgi:hypothetical protein
MTRTADARTSRRRDGVVVGSAALYALALLVAAQAADYLTFLAMVGIHGLSAELNPIVVALAVHGFGPLTVAKAATVVLVAGAFLVGRRHRPGVAQLTLGLGIIAGAMGAVSNLATL